jgi:hypothetical protein
VTASASSTGDALLLGFVEKLGHPVIRVVSG